MLLAGGVSIIAGVAYVIAAAGDHPRLNMLALYAAAGGTDFVVRAGPPIHERTNGLWSAALTAPLSPVWRASGRCAPYLSDPWVRPIRG
jgi:hypothetical protein